MEDCQLLKIFFSKGAIQQLCYHKEPYFKPFLLSLFFRTSPPTPLQVASFPQPNPQNPKILWTLVNYYVFFSKTYVSQKDYYGFPSVLKKLGQFDFSALNRLHAPLTHSTPPPLSLSLFRIALPSQQPAGDIIVEWVLPYRLPPIVQQHSTTIFVIIYRERQQILNRATQFNDLSNVLFQLDFVKTHLSRAKSTHLERIFCQSQ